VTYRSIHTNQTEKRLRLMGELITYLLEEVHDDPGRWMVVDGAVINHKEMAPWEQEWMGRQEDWIEVGPNALVCDTPRDITAHVRLELWSDQPPAPESAWDHSWTGEIFLRSGKIQLRGFYNGEWGVHEVFDLGHRDATWLVRAQHKTLENDREADFPRDIYRADIYKFQFWRPILQQGS
jgi:hypothetical protein